MGIHMKKILYFLIAVIVLAACKESYKPNISYPETGYLVVEGFINSRPAGVTSIKLSRTVKLDTNINTRRENFAKVTIEGDNNSSYALTGNNSGTYSSGQLNLSSTAKYRLRIITSDGKTYLSDYATAVKTPPIDSVNFKMENNGLQLYINTHDPKNSTWYYRWEYDETWEYHSLYMPALRYKKDAAGIPNGIEYINADQTVDTSKFKCWQFFSSTNIITGTSTKLSEDKITLPLLFIDETSWKISVLYSVNVRQYGLSRNGYDFWQKMKRNTEQLGSIFDAQPSEITGNVHCVSNPSEPVIGYVEVADGQEKRVFISRAQVPDWKYRSDCIFQEVTNQKDSIQAYSYLLPIDGTQFGASPNIILAFGASTPGCVDCTTRGGTNVKPSYWP